MVVTWNPTDKGASTNLSNGNLTATPIYQTSSVKSTLAQNKGKWFCEIKIDALNFNCIGIGKPSLSMVSSITASTDFYYYYQDGRKSNGGATSAYGTAMVVGSIIGILVDFDKGTLTFYNNGVNQGVAFSDIKKLGEFCIIASSGTLSGTGGVTANFGATQFVYPLDRTVLPFGVKSYDGSQVLSYEQKTLIKDSEGYKTIIEGHDFVAGVNVIPKMTNDTTPPPFVASASSSYSSYTAFYAFDQVFNGTSRWISNMTPPVWCKISLDIPRKVSKYRLASGHISQQISSWVLQGSNDNSIWTDLDTVANHPLSIDKYDDFTIDNPYYYKHYRVYVNATTNNTIASLSGFALLTEDTPATATHWELISTTTPTAHQFLEKGISELAILNRKVVSLESESMSDETEILQGENGKVFGLDVDLKKYFDIRNVKAVDNLATTGGLTFKNNGRYSIITFSEYRKVINMTSNNSPAPFVASASGSNSGFPPWKAFDGVTTGSTIGWAVAARTGWLQIDFGKTTGVSGFTLHSGKNGGYYFHDFSPSVFNLAGSHDGQKWEIIQNYTASWGSNNASNLSKEFICKPTMYRYYRLNVDNVGNGSQIYVGEMFFKVFDIGFVEYPLDSKYLSVSKLNSIMLDVKFEDKKYTMQSDSENLASVELTNKPLSIKFD